MSSALLKAEQHYHDLLPVKRLTQSPPAELMAAAKAWSDLVWEEAMSIGPMLLADEVLADGLELSKHPVFICGVHRSGTTLVRNLLDGHPDLMVLPSEGTYYTNLESKLNALPENQRMAFLGKEWLCRLVNPINQPPYWLLGRSSATASPYADFARYFMVWWNILQQKENTQWPHLAVVLAYAASTNNIKAKYWVDKTPANERYLERIWREAPSAKIIHVVRNPVDIMSSRKKMEPGAVFYNTLRDMKLSFKVADRYNKEKRFLLVRYEGLCDQPEKVTGQFASFLNIASTEILVQSTVGNMAAQPNSSFNDNTSAGRFILKPERNQSPDILSSVEQNLLTAYMSKAAARLNYPVTKQGIMSKYYYTCKFWLFLYLLILCSKKM